MKKLRRNLEQLEKEELRRDLEKRERNRETILDNFLFSRLTVFSRLLSSISKVSLLIFACAHSYFQVISVPSNNSSLIPSRSLAEVSLMQDFNQSWLKVFPSSVQDGTARFFQHPFSECSYNANGFSHRSLCLWRRKICVIHSHSLTTILINFSLLKLRYCSTAILRP